MADAKKAPAKKVTVVMRGSSPGYKDGDEQKVSAEVADFLVENKLARHKSG